MTNAPASSDPVPRTRPVPRMRPVSLSIRARLLLIAGSMIVALLVGEALVRIARPGFPGFRLPQVAHRTVVGLGFEMVPNQTAYSTASLVHINSAGFRGPEIRPLADAGYPRVLALGDSMTFGVAVEDHETYPQQLQALLAAHPGARDPEVINTGVQRYFTFQEIDLLKELAVELRPDVVTLGVYANDLGVRPTGDYVREYENEREQAATAFRNRFRTAYLIAKNSALIEFLKNSYLHLSEMRRPASTVQNALDGIINERDEPKWQGVEQELATFAQLAEEHGFTPVVLFIPVRQQVQRDLPQSLYPGRLADHARRLGLTVVDPIPIFKASLREGHDPYLPWDDHLSVTGHRLVAEALASVLSEDTWTRHRPAGVASQGRR